ncbi:hypothetical protein FQZ97_1119550 [compost metagenome]
MHDTDIEREPVLLLESLKPKALPADVSTFFSSFVHDSMAGFIGFGMPEFEANGFGLAKFRRIYAGNRGDDFLRGMVVRANERKVAAAQALRTKTAQWRMESENYRRANPNSW